MRISDWSSDVCSSDLHIEGIGGVAPVCCGIGQGTDYLLHVPECPGPTMVKDQRDRLRPLTRLPDEMNGKPVNCDAVMGELVDRDRKSVVEGKSVSVRVDLGGRRTIKKKINKKNCPQTNTY